MTSLETRQTVRAVTEGEIAFFDEHGWVKLAGLVDPERISAMLEIARVRMGADGADGDAQIGAFSDLRHPSGDEPAFRDVSQSSELGRNHQRLIGRRGGGTRFYTDAVSVKLSSAHGAASSGGQATGFHQDPEGRPFDQPSLTFWIALDDITPEHGSLVFRSGSHRLGLLGDLHDPAVYDTWREQIERCPLSEPHQLSPGDATVHHVYTVHGAAANTTSSPRWSYRTTYFPADARYTGANSYIVTPELGLTPGERIENERFPLVFDGSA